MDESLFPSIQRRYMSQAISGVLTSAADLASACEALQDALSEVVNNDGEDVSLLDSELLGE
eukprot:6207627-Alexandrium_andersonii.AAC.1